IMDQQNRLARDQAALDDLAEIKAEWDQAAEAARYVAALHQYVAQQRKQASQILDKLRAAKLRRRGPALYLQQALKEIGRLERQEAEAARTPLPHDQQQLVAEITRGLPADVESMIQRVVAVEYWFSKWGPARTGVWKVPGQLTLSGSDPASQGVSGRIAANKKEIAQIQRQIAWQRARHSPDVNRLRDALARLRRQDAVLKGIKLRRKFTRELARGGWLALTPRQIAQIRDRAAGELARAPRVWPSPIQLGAIEAKAAKVAGQESAAQQAVRRRKGILTELSALRDAIRRAWDSTGRANKKARAEVEGLQSYLAAWKLTGPGQEPVPPASTVIRKVFLIDPKGKPVSVRDEETHPDNTASPYTSKNPLSWGGVQAVQDKTPGKAYMVTRFPPYSWKSLIWPFGGTLPVRLHDINVFKVGLSYLKGVKFRVVERSGYTDVKLRSPGEMLRINPPGPNLPGVMPVSLGEGVTVWVGTFFSWQYSFIPPGSDDVYGYADGPGKTKISVRRLVGSTSDGLPRWWTDTTRGGEMTLVPAIPGPRLAPQLKAGGGLQVSIGWPVNLNHLLRTWNALATLINHVIGHKVKLPHAQLYPQGQAPGVGAVGFVIQVQVTPEHKYQISVQAADPRAWHEIELNIGREIVFSPYFYFGDKHVAGGVGFSGVPGNFVVGRSVADWPKLKALVEKGLSKVVPGLRAPMRRKILASIRRGLAQLEQQARAAAAAQQLADS